MTSIEQKEHMLPVEGFVYLLSSSVRRISKPRSNTLTLHKRRRKECGRSCPILTCPSWVK